MDKPYQHESTLEDLYQDKGLSGVDIAEKFGVSAETVYTWMDKHGIERTGKDTSHLPAPKEIARLYVDEGKSTPEIADKFDVSLTPIRNRLLDFGVEMRGSGSYQIPPKLRDSDWLCEKNHTEELRAGEIADIVGCSEGAVYSAFRRHGIENIYNRTPQMEAQDTLRDADELRRLYHGEGLSTVKIADRIGVNQSTVYHWMDKHGIETRSKSEIVGELHPRFDPDYEYHVYDEEWEDVREAVILRDGEECQECGLGREECKDQLGMDLDVHHIIPQTEVKDKYDMENLTTMCRSCHTSLEQSSG